MLIQISNYVEGRCNINPWGEDLSSKEKGQNFQIEKEA